MYKMKAFYVYTNEINLFIVAYSISFETIIVVYIYTRQPLSWFEGSVKPSFRYIYSKEEEKREWRLEMAAKQMGLSPQAA